VLCAAPYVSATLASRVKIELPSQVDLLGWAEYIRSNPRPMTSMAAIFHTWDARRQAHHLTLTDKNWSNKRVALVSLSRPWHGKLQSLLAANTSRLVVAAGESLYSYGFAATEQAGVRLGATFGLSGSQGPRRDITGITFVPGTEDTLCLGFQDGSLERVRLPSPPVPASRVQVLDANHRERYDLDAGSFIKSLSASRDRLLAVSYSGRATLFAPDAAGPQPTHVELQRKCWAAHLNLRASAPFAAFGSTSATPLTVHAVAEAGLAAEPTAHLGAAGSEHSRPAAYALCQPACAGGPWGAPDPLLISGWFDGVVRCYDLRSATPVSGAPGTPVARRPVLSLHDPWAYEAFYAVGAGGGAHAHVAGGSARHALVALWDVRRPRAGWSAYGPGDGSSPVYALHVESARAFGATQSRAFALDFAPGAPTAPVTKYMHATGHDR
jgi:hypothetical protein